MNSQTPFAIITGDFVTTGGMDRANHALASYLLRQGHPVDLVAFRADENLLAYPNAAFHRVAKPWNSYALGLSLLKVQGRDIAKRVSATGGRVIANGGNCRWDDINWVHYVHAAWKPSYSGSLPRRIKSAYFHQKERRSERLCLRDCRVVIANSERTRTDLIDLLGLNPDRVRTVYYGSDPSTFYPATPDEKAEIRRELGWDDDRPTIAFVGALGDARKGFDTLFDAMKLLANDSGWDARLAVVGTGATLDHWKQQAEALGMTRSVTFLGFRKDVPRLLKACDALVSPTRYEAYGLNVHEALCSGIPALVTATAGVSERYPAALQDWLMPNPEDAADLARRLLHWREGHASALTHSAILALSEQLRSETWDAMALKFLSVVDELS